MPHQRVKMDALTWHASPLHPAHHTTHDDDKEGGGYTVQGQGLARPDLKGPGSGQFLGELARPS